jgi:hypothetical protein
MKIKKFLTILVITFSYTLFCAEGKGQNHDTLQKDKQLAQEKAEADAVAAEKQRRINPIKQIFHDGHTSYTRGDFIKAILNFTNFVNLYKDNADLLGSWMNSLKLEYDKANLYLGKIYLNFDNNPHIRTNLNAARQYLNTALKSNDGTIRGQANSLLSRLATEKAHAANEDKGFSKEQIAAKLRQ